MIHELTRFGVRQEPLLVGHDVLHPEESVHLPALSSRERTQPPIQQSNDCTMII